MENSHMPGVNRSTCKKEKKTLVLTTGTWLALSIFGHSRITASEHNEPTRTATSKRRPNKNIKTSRRKRFAKNWGSNKEGKTLSKTASSMSSYNGKIGLSYCTCLLFGKFWYS